MVPNISINIPLNFLTFGFVVSFFNIIRCEPNMVPTWVFNPYSSPIWIYNLVLRLKT